MHELTLLAQAQENEVLIQSPGVGVISKLPMPGQILTPETPVGQMLIISTPYILKLPPHTTGEVARYDTEFKIRAVGYGDPLFTLLPIQEKKSQGTNSASTNHSQVAQGWVVRAPTDGIFYRKPSPDAPPYISLQQEVKTSQILGLVEVMKCFNPILFDGSEFPAKAKVLEICVADGSEVKYNQPLFVFGEC